MLGRASRKRHINYDERDLDESITQRLVEEDSGGDEEYNDFLERKEGGYSLQSGQWDDDDDIITPESTQELRQSTVTKSKPVKKSVKQKKVTYNFLRRAVLFFNMSECITTAYPCKLSHVY